MFNFCKRFQISVIYLNYKLYCLSGRHVNSHTHYFGSLQYFLIQTLSIQTFQTRVRDPFRGESIINNCMHPKKENKTKFPIDVSSYLLSEIQPFKIFSWSFIPANKPRSCSRLDEFWKPLIVEYLTTSGFHKFSTVEKVERSAKFKKKNFKDVRYIHHIFIDCKVVSATYCCNHRTDTG